MNRTIWSN